MSDWRPISTAPRDGTEFLAYDAVAKKFDVCEMREMRGRDGLFWACVAVQSDGEYGPESDEFGYDFDNVTLWQPLPDLPA